MSPIRALLAAAVLLVALLVTSASGQYIYVANAGDDTVSKININTNQVVATYATWFNSGTNNLIAPHINNAWAGPAPSRIQVGFAGDVYVLDRFFSSGTGSTFHTWSNPPHFPVLIKIAPGGSPTSTGSTPLTITDSNSSNDIETSLNEAADKWIQWAKPIGTGVDITGVGRSLAIDPSGNLWVGMFSSMRYWKVSSATGSVIGSFISTAPHRPYGGVVDINGKLWSVDETNTLAEIDTVTGLPVTVLDHTNFGPNHLNFGQNYSLAIFNDCSSVPYKVKVYISARGVGKTFMVYDPQTNTFSAAPLAPNYLFDSIAIGLDHNGNIVSGEYQNTGRIIKTTPGGTVLWDQTPTTVSGHKIPDLHGIIVDDNDDVWAVDLNNNRLIKYSGLNGQWLATVPVGNRPYTYGNPPPPTCPCAAISEHPIQCAAGQSGGTATYSWSFLFTNHSPFPVPATAIDISSSQVTNLTPTHFQFTNPVPVNGQATVSGSFTVANPVAGSQVCLDIRLNAGEGWCCPLDHVCFLLPECQRCAKLQGQFSCQHGNPVLGLSITNMGPSPAQSVTIYSNTPGVTVSPQITTQTFPQNVPVIIPLTVTGAAPGQTISLSVSLAGPIDPNTGVNTWCCTSTITVTYPTKPCLIGLGGWVFNDLNRDGVRGSEESALSGWTVTFTDAKGTPRTAITDQGGTYSFEDVEAGTYRLSVQPLSGWRATLPEGGVVTVTPERTPTQKFNFGFVRVQP